MKCTCTLEKCRTVKHNRILVKVVSWGPADFTLKTQSQKKDPGWYSVVPIWKLIIMFKSIIINILHSCSYVSILPLQQGPFSHCNKHRFMPNIQYYFTVPVYKGLVFYASDSGNGVHPVQQRYKEIRHFAQQVSLYIRKCEYVSEFIICSTSRLWS